MRQLLAVATGIVLSASACGGGSDSSTGTTDPNLACSSLTNGTMSATINGAAWSGCGTASVQSNLAVSGKDTLTTLAFQATGFAPGNALWVINVGFTNGKGLLVPGSYAVGPANPTTAAFIITGSTGGWAANALAGTGVVNVTVVGPHRVAGTFSADPVAVQAGTSGPAQIRNGKFDLSY
jgi:hypothetical protein